MIKHSSLEKKFFFIFNRIPLVNENFILGYKDWKLSQCQKFYPSFNHRTIIEYIWCLCLVKRKFFHWKLFLEIKSQITIDCKASEEKRMTFIWEQLVKKSASRGYLLSSGFSFGLTGSSPLVITEANFGFSWRSVISALFQ